MLNDKIVSARLDVEVLLAFALSWPRARLYSHGDYALKAAEQLKIAELVNRRLSGEPIAYIVGQQEFWSLSFAVSSATLIPRPETEHLVEIALTKIPQNEAYQVLDLGTGSGAIALSIAKERPHSIVTAVDISPEAVAIAEHNQSKLEIPNVSFLVSNWYESLNNRVYDIIVSNPPYIAEQDPHLTKGDLRFEPDVALSSGKDGLNAIEHIISFASRHLKTNGWLLLEHGYQQAEAVQELMCQHGFQAVQSLDDLSGNERVTFATLQ